MLDNPIQIKYKEGNKGIRILTNEEILIKCL